MANALKPVSMGALLALVILVSAEPALAQESGFLGDYSALSEVKDATGEKVLRYVNPKLKPGDYKAVMIDPTQYYPAPKPTQQVSESTLSYISSYLDKGLRETLGARVVIASQPGPGVLRVRPAITAIAPKTPDMKPFLMIPLAFVVPPVADSSKEATIQIEVDVVDSVTGERMGASVRKGAGAKLASEKTPLTLADVVPLLDKWIDVGSSFVAERIK